MATSSVLSRPSSSLSCRAISSSRECSSTYSSRLTPLPLLRGRVERAHRVGEGHVQQQLIGRTRHQFGEEGRAPFGGVLRGHTKRHIAVNASGESLATEIPSEAPAAASFKHILLPIIDSNPYLSSGTRAAASTVTSLARAFGSDITVAVVDEGPFAGDKELRAKNIRWHLAEGGFENFALIEKEGQNPGAAIGEIADDMNLDLVVLGMESIHSKQIDGNTLAEFVPCPVLLLP
ncbi:hypothetical protein KFL_000440060 [Klebsormidium nitens]|uniref:Uncharacterized protein n=1 Tax=Klebsormidium nitens TaxID=105231 RepID=A0A1Y1HN00_KLENI|nr:hypothetical protein KFL_000440060 [Klebsormidium nitens]|eukprot:GAQ80004.1 hypothetical protein KFL_000440060 [Klebsormidium nitens]